MTAGHLALLAWLGLRAPQTTMTVMDEPTAVEVFVLPPPPRPDERPPRPSSVLRPRQALPPPVGAVAVPEPTPIVETPPPPTAPGAPSEQTRTALRRSLINCLETSRIAPEDRTFCEERRTAIKTTDEAIGPLMTPDKQAEYDQTANRKARERKAWEGVTGRKNGISDCNGSQFGMGCLAR